MNHQELAKLIASLDFTSVQADNMDENYKLHFIKEQLNELPQEQACDLLLKVMEARECARINPALFGGMLEFNYV